MDLYNRLELGDFKNIDDSDYESVLNSYIYQILPLKYAKLIIEKHVLRFNNIGKSWDDPYELFIYKENIDIEGTSIDNFLDNWAARFYGQCWSFNKDSDAMWRIYSRNKDSVRIKTKIINIIELLNQTRGMLWTAPSFGKVVYRTTNDIISWLDEFEVKGWGVFLDYFSNSLFYKREEFKHENEVRFIINQTNNYEIKDYIEMQIPQSNFIEEIALDPRLNKQEFNDTVEQIKPFSGNIPICQSDLYKFDPIHLSLKNTPIVLHNALDAYYKRNEYH